MIHCSLRHTGRPNNLCTFWVKGPPCFNTGHRYLETHEGTWALPLMTPREIYEFRNGYFDIIRPPHILILSAFTTYSYINFALSFNYKHILKYSCTSIPQKMLHQFFFELIPNFIKCLFFRHFYWSSYGQFLSATNIFCFSHSWVPNPWFTMRSATYMKRRHSIILFSVIKCGHQY